MEEIFQGNEWVNIFYAPHTFEFDFATDGKNLRFMEALLPILYKREQTIQEHLQRLKGGPAEQYDEVLFMAEKMGKGWMATVLSNMVDDKVNIPEYIIQAVGFAATEAMPKEIRKHLILKQYPGGAT